MEVWSDRVSTCKFRKALRALRNLHVDPLSLHTSMRNKQVEFNPLMPTQNGFLYDRCFEHLVLIIRLYSDGKYYGMVMSVCPSIRPGLRPSVTVFRTFSYMLWRIELKFCMSLSSYEHSIKFECRQYPSPTCFGILILSWILYMTFIEWTSYQVRVPSIFVGVMPLL